MPKVHYLTLCRSLILSLSSGLTRALHFSALAKHTIRLGKEVNELGTNFRG